MKAKKQPAKTRRVYYEVPIEPEQETYEPQSSIKKRLDALEQGGKNSKNFKVPMKGKISNSKLRKGYATVVTIHDNQSIDFTREKIIDGTIKLEGGDLSFHAVDSKDIFSYKGKPLIFQPKKKLNPYNPLSGDHETYGQKYVMARMEGDKISLKKSMGGGMWIGMAVIIAIIAYGVFFGA